jgi:hypothetical protein
MFGEARIRLHRSNGNLLDGGVDLPIKGLTALSDGAEIGEILDGMA